MILIQGSTILAKDVTETETTIEAKGVSFPKHVLGAYEIVDADVPGPMAEYEWINGTVKKKPPTPEQIAEAKAAKLLELAAYRYERETAGIIVNGIEIKTDRESQTMIVGAKVLMDLNPTKLLDWKGKKGWAKLNKTAVEAIGNAVGDHVQNCFAKERVHSDAINILNTIAAVEAYDITVNW